MPSHLNNLNTVGPMQLCFVCPVTGKDYASENWWILGELHIREEIGGIRMLAGKVAVECPYCRSTHAHLVEELVCPWSQAEG